jgi:tRNA (Thr-GGU) A37 N-methylase
MYAYGSGKTSSSPLFSNLDLHLYPIGQLIKTWHGQRKYPTQTNNISGKITKFKAFPQENNSLIFIDKMQHVVILVIYWNFTPGAMNIQIHGITDIKTLFSMFKISYAF